MPGESSGPLHALHRSPQSMARQIGIRLSDTLRWFIVAGLLWVAGGTAQVRIAPTYRLHIDSQPLEQALQEFASQSGVQIIFFSQIMEDRLVEPLDGEFTMQVALTRLLAGFPLTFRIINPRTVQILPRPQADVPGGRRAPWADRSPSPLTISLPI